MNILWDFDGTLFDTYPAYTDIFYEVLGGTIKKEEIFDCLKVSASHAIKHYGLSDEQIKGILAKEDDLHPRLTPPFPGVEDILQFTEVNVIMTHKPRNEVINILKYYGWEEYFKEIVAGDDGYPRKPDPASYKYLHDKYGIDLVIGDRELDILPAKTLGIKTCLFQNSTEGADYYLTKYDDFFNFVRPQNDEYT